jgi:hypothetical protein
MRRHTRRKGTSKRTSKRRYKGTSKRTSKRVTRKQSGGEWVNRNQMNDIIKKRFNASTLSDLSAKKAQEFKELIEKESS